MGRGSRGLPDNTSGHLEDRGGRVVRTVQELRAGRMVKEEKREKGGRKNEENRKSDKRISRNRSREWKKARRNFKNSMVLL